MESSKERSLETINEVLLLAKLSEKDIKPLSQTLYFANENFDQDNLKLLQLDSYLSKEIAEGNTLYIKGDADDDVVICSETRTFHVLEAETSNSLLLVSNLEFSDKVEEGSQRVNKVSVSRIFYNYLEAQISKPCLKKLSILNDSIYKGPEHEYEVNKGKLYTFEQLTEIIQASNKELKEALALMNVIELDGKIRILDFEYHFRVLSYMLKLIEENSWQLDEIDYEETINALKELVPREIIYSLFDKYTEESVMIEGIQLYRYKEDEICKFFAQVLLHDAGKFNLDEFLQAWSESVPEGLIPTEEMLHGIAIIDRKCNPNVIWAFDENSLPDNIIERFKVLFEAKEKWTVPEIAPYIKKLTTEKLDVNALLAKHARASTVDGVKYYSSKHGK